MVDHFGGGIVHTKADVVGDGIREEEIVLWNIGAGSAHRMDGQGVHVLAVHKQGAVRHVVGAQQQVHQRRFARAGLAHNAHAFAGVDGEGDVLQHIVFAVRVAEGQVAEFHTALRVLQLLHAGAVGHINGGVQQLGDAVQGSLAAGSLFDQHGNCHDGPDDGLKIADVLYQLARVEPALVDQITAIPQDDTDDGFDKQGHEHFQQGGNFGVDDVDLLVLFVQLAERHELFQLFDKRLDNGNAGEILLCKV